MKREVKVGIFALLTLLALYWGINFLKGSDMLRSNKTYYALYDQVNGLQKSAPVVIKGFKIGVISDIKYNPAETDKIIVEMSIKSKYKVPDDTRARIFSDGLLGNKAIELELGQSEEYLKSGDTLPSEMDKDLFDVAGSELEFMKQKAGQLADNITLTLNNINSLLTKNEEAITSAMSNLSAMTNTLNNVIQSEESSLRGVLANMNELSVTLKNNTGKIDNIIGNVEGITDSLNNAGLSTTVANLTQTLGEFNGMMASVNSGEGTLGKLMSDEQLYEALVTASDNLGVLLEDLKEHPGRYLHFSVFGKKEK